MNEPNVGPARAILRPRGRWRADLRWGAGWAGAFAAAFSLWVLAQSALRGSIHWNGSAIHTTLWRILAAYWATAAVISVVLGTLRPWLGRRAGAALAGLLSGAALYGVFDLSVDASSEWSDTLVPTTLTMSELVQRRRSASKPVFKPLTRIFPC